MFNQLKCSINCITPVGIAWCKRIEISSKLMEYNDWSGERFVW